MTPSPARPGVSRIAVKAYAVLVGLGLLMATVFHLTIVEAVRDNALAQQEQSALALQECRYLVKDFGTSQSPKSTRQRDSRYCPDRPALITTPSRT
ncbi:MAG: hypothetical protein B0D94_09710, partial [Candidatus Sedimenticola endophacoides]